MSTLTLAPRSLIVLALLAALAVPAAAQDRGQGDGGLQVTGADVQRLQEMVHEAAADLSRLRSQDAARADRLQARLDDLRDEVVYLRVKLRKDGVSRAEYRAVRLDVEDLRAEVREQPQPQPPARSARPDEIPAGTEFDVRLDQRVSSETAQLEDRVTATTVADLYRGDRVLIPAGSPVRGLVTSVSKAGRVERTGKLTLAFDRLTVNGDAHPIHGVVTQALESGGYRQDAGKIGAGAGVGAILGGLLGGVRGALAGIVVGGGGVVAATEGQNVTLPSGSVLRVRLESPVTVK